ncbi:MAG: hypothetical protein U0168_18475 [Nannocystaceae bacterium]
MRARGFHVEGASSRPLRSRSATTCSPAGTTATSPATSGTPSGAAVSRRHSRSPSSVENARICPRTPGRSSSTVATIHGSATATPVSASPGSTKVRSMLPLARSTTTSCCPRTGRMTRWALATGWPVTTSGSVQRVRPWIGSTATTRSRSTITTSGSAAAGASTSASATTASARRLPWAGACAGSTRAHAPVPSKSASVVAARSVTARTPAR